MNRRPLSIATMLALGVVGAPAPVRFDAPPLADDRKPQPRGNRAGGWGVPFENLKHVAIETVNPPGSRDPVDRQQRTERRRARMRLRKRRGWR